MSFYRGEWNKKYTLDENIFESIDTPEKAFWLGFIYAEGGIDTSVAYKLVINQHLEHKERLYKFRDFLKSDVPIKEYPSYKSPRATVRICRKKIVQDLEKHGVIERKSAKLCFPGIPPEYHSDFIRGFFFGDGTLGKREGKHWAIAFYSKALVFLKQIQSILMKRCDLRQTKILNTGQKNSGVYCLRYSGNTQVPRILKYLSLQEN